MFDINIDKCYKSYNIRISAGIIDFAFALGLHRLCHESESIKMLNNGLIHKMNSTILNIKFEPDNLLENNRSVNLYNTKLKNSYTDQLHDVKLLDYIYSQF